MFSDTKGVRGFASNPLGHGKDRFLQFFGWDNVVDQTDAMSLICGNHVPGHDHLVGLAVADQTFQSLGRSVAGD